MLPDEPRDQPATSGRPIYLARQIQQNNRQLKGTSRIAVQEYEGW
jgi:hypothetical protein